MTARVCVIQLPGDHVLPLNGKTNTENKEEEFNEFGCKKVSVTRQRGEAKGRDTEHFQIRDRGQNNRAGKFS